MQRDEIYSIGYPAKNAYKPFINLVLKYVSKNDKILDVGGGEGTYSAELKKRGYDVVCVDINEEYIEKSKKKGIESYVMDATSLDFPEKSFDVVLLFEVIEHIDDFIKVLRESKRLSKKLIIITTPNCSGIDELKFFNLTYYHLLASDHVNFFTKKDLQNILSAEFDNFNVEESESLLHSRILGAIGLPIWLRFPILLLYKLNFRTNIYNQLYGIIELK